MAAVEVDGQTVNAVLRQPMCVEINLYGNPESFYPCAGAVTDASAAGAPAGLTEAMQLVVEDADGPVMAAVEVDGQTVNAVLLQPMSAEAAKEAASHQIVALKYAHLCLSSLTAYLHVKMPHGAQIISNRMQHDSVTSKTPFKQQHCRIELGGKLSSKPDGI